MDTTEKAKEIKANILKKYANEFEVKLDEVLTFCESPIEKLFILQFIDFFYTKKFGDFLTPYRGLVMLRKYHDHGSIQDPYIYNRENYRYIGGVDYEIYNGFKINLTTLNIANNKGPIYQRELKFYPQHEVTINNKKYRIDLAVILIQKNYNIDEIKKSKLALEFDGYDYHKQPEKFKEDKIRERALKRNGWKEVLRYSGSEIYHVGKDLEKTSYNFEEILEILHLNEQTNEERNIQFFIRNTS